MGVGLYERMIEQQNAAAIKAEQAGNALKAKTAYNQIINAYNKMIQMDPSNASEYKERIREYQEKINNVAAGVPNVQVNASNQGRTTVGEQPKNNNGGRAINNSGSNNKDAKDNSNAGSKVGSGVVDEEELAEALKDLNELVGIQGVKTKIAEWVNQVRIFQERKARNMKVAPITYHMVFTGNPGTGKTTVARKVAKIYHALGICATDHTEETDRGDLVSNHVGETALKTREVLDKAYGGVLFVDEAYTLKPKGEGTDFGQEAIDALLKAMEDRRDELVVIAAGYEDDMRRFINSNAGLSSRFKNFIDFGDYNGEELYKIFSMQAKKNEYEIPAECEDMLKRYFQNLYDNRDENFGNARTVRNFFENLATAQANRLAASGVKTRDLTDEDLKVFTKADVENVIIQSATRKEKD